MTIRQENVGNIPLSLNSVNVINTSSLFSIQNSAGWIVSSTILNSANWVVNVANTGGSMTVSNTQTAINIINSANWVFAQSNTNNQGVIVLNSGGLFAQQSGAWNVSSTILNSGGWIVNIANTAGISIANTAGISIANTAGWVINDSSTFIRPAIVSVTTVVSTIGVATLLTNNVSRLFATFYNDSTVPLYLKLGASATTFSFTIKITSSGYYELPQPAYTGIITGLWGSANGTCYVGEGT